MKKFHSLPAVILLLLLLPVLSGCDTVFTDINVACLPSALVSAVNSANASPDTLTTLHLDPGCVYELTSPVATDTTLTPADVGLPEITSPITIDGQGATIRRSAASGTPEFRIFLVAGSGILKLNNIFLAGGDVRSTSSAGGAVLNHGTLEINTCDVLQNYAEDGGAVYNTGRFYTLWSVYYENEAAAHGGAISNTGRMTLDRSQFFQNAGVIGGAVENDGGVITVEGSIFSQNRGGLAEGDDGLGAAIYNSADPDLGEPGKVTISSSRFEENSASHGGAIVNLDPAEMIIRDSVFHANHAEQAGAILNHAQLTVERSLFYENSALEYGGALYTRTWEDANITTISNSTFSGNQSALSTGNEESGSAIYHSLGGLSLSYVTITGNSGDPAYTNDGGMAAIGNSIIAGNPGGDCGGSGLGALDVPGSSNLDSDGSCPGFDITAPPLLDPLADNSGPTMTHALQEHSPALGHAAGFCPLEDQRGMVRPYGPGCDLGAFESQEYTTGLIPEPEEPEALATVPVPEEPHEIPDWWWKFEGYVCSDSGLTEFYISTDAGAELFNLQINERGVKCYQQTYDKTRYWCHVELAPLGWELPSAITFCVGEICEEIQRTTLSQARCEGSTPLTEPEPQVCTAFETRQDCSAAPGCTWQCMDFAAGETCACTEAP